MKLKSTIILFISFIATSSFAQSGVDAWKELKDFHSVMAATFHPSEENDFAPVKSRAGELNEKANVLAKSTPPKELNTPKIKESLTKLQADTKTLESMVKEKKSDEEIKNQISKAHDTFHEIMGMCRGGGHEKDMHEKEEKHKE